MNRRQKIIVSITGIFLVLLILVGLTYGYFLTRIQGNTNSKSISTSTADLKLVYGDGSGTLSPATKLVPNTTVGTKTFSVKNEGDAKVDDYVVVFENVQNPLDRPEDLVYTVTCTSNKASNTCNGVEDKSFPKGEGIIVVNSIEKDETQTYELTLKYLEPGVDQSSDMNKTIEGKINIRDGQTINPYKNQKDTLAYKIINSAMNITGEEIKKGYAEFRTTPLTEPAKESTTIYYVGESSKEDSYNVSGTYKYGDSYKFNNKTGTFDIVNKDGSDLKTLDSTSSNYEVLKGKYIPSYSGNGGASVTNEVKIYQVTDITGALMKYKTLTVSRTKYDNAENTLSMSDDNFGVSYYYRGGVKNNYVQFADMCWRIVRIEGDGSIKLALANTTTCSESMLSNENTAFIGKGMFGYSTYDRGDGYDSYSANYEDDNTDRIRMKLESWFNTNLTSYSDKIKSSKICLGNVQDIYIESGSAPNYTYTNKGNLSDTERNKLGVWYYEKYVNIFSKNLATYKCSENEESKKEYKVYPLTVDEVIFAGGMQVEAHESNWSGVGPYGGPHGSYIYENANEGWWTATVGYNQNMSGGDYVEVVGAISSPTETSGGVDIKNDGIYGVPLVYNENYRPAISLNPGTEISDGDGSISSPYIIK